MNLPWAGIPIHPQIVGHDYGCSVATSSEEFTLTADSASATIDTSHGGRLASLVVDSHELLVTMPIEHRAGDPFGWGAYPMVPWAGRVARGQFAFQGDQHQMPINMGDHSLHGTGFTAGWRRVGSDAVSLTLEDPWPFGGTVSQTFELTASFFRCRMTVTAQQAMPVMIGWHPWFVRQLDGQEATLSFGEARMYERGQDGIPTGQLIDVPDGPWDDCFTDLTERPRIDWGDTLSIELQSSCDHWVLYTEPDHALCVEPQSGPPNQFNTEPDTIGPKSTFEAWYSISWSI